MTAELEISEEIARVAAHAWFGSPTKDVSPADERVCIDDMRDLLKRVGPLIVADELVRLVNDTDWAWAVGSGLVRRAEELRGQAKGGGHA